MSGSLAPGGWSGSERGMWAAFRRGEWFADEGEVRASVVRRLLLAPPPAEAGHLPRLRLRDVRITGRLDLAEAVVPGTLRLRNCRFEQAPCLDGASVGALEMRDCVLPGLSAVGVTIGWKCEISGCRVEGPIDLYGASIGGTLHLENSRLTGHGERRGERALQLLCATIGGDIQAGTGLHVDGCTDLRDTSVRGSVVLKRAELLNPSGIALKANRLHIGGNLSCGGLVAEGTVDLCDARVGGGALFEGASLTAEHGPALRAHGIDVGAVFNCCDGFTARGRVTLSSITVRSRVCFQDAVIDVPPGTPALTCRRSTASELALTTREPVRGTVDLSHTRLTVLRGTPDSWPNTVRLEAVVYDSLLPQLPAVQRLPLLTRDPEGFTPQPYEQLAAAYRLHGHDGDARTVLLAKQRRLRTTLPWPGRVWSRLQDVTVGYGYRPMRAMWWLYAIMLSGILLFTRWPPQAVDPGKPPHFQAAIYTLDLVLPLVDFGQEQAFSPRGGLQWAAVVLVCLGWLLATTAAAGANRMLRRA
ncbi:MULTISPECIES: oxidoreductase [unclassified Streptomyces]|uniref:oxidoreductase n=1 Tax=unclassified Streptomyces TaxID=2593676 RepID=UPI002E806EC2|nr:oxidoreductase [Streptomyces sp. NBC_00589]WTI34127.1 oxidoreductase [Streptomyces sp. NBC_00775]WUB32200.1 oxidoreductase [Streptomyces sp. NBC_00589]